jgi:two-component system response regulator AtoC
MKNKQRLLIIDDEDNMRHMLSSMLTRLGYAVETAANGLRGLEMLAGKVFDVVLCDIRMPEMDGMEFLRRVSEEGISTTIIMMSAFGTVETALEAMRRGAYDYISKPFKADEIELTLRKAGSAKNSSGIIRNCATGWRPWRGVCFGRMVARSKVMQDVFVLATKVAPHPTTVLITGESGTGKELVAQGIHEISGRTAGVCGGQLWQPAGKPDRE